MNSCVRSKKEWMKEQLDKMDVDEHSQILSIIQKYTSHSTRTQNGILISTDELSDECLNEVEQYIHFLLDQRKRIDEDSKARKTYERMVQ